jgi:hypothetical protein
MIRRTSWRYYLNDASAVARRTATWMARELKWDEKRIGDEIARYETTSSLRLGQSPEA